MGFLARLFGRQQPPAVAAPRLAERRLVLDYLRRQRSGQRPDPDFEAKSLNALGLTTLDLVELISAHADDCGLFESQVREFIAIGRPPNRKLANLFQRVRILAQSGLGEE